MLAVLALGSTGCEEPGAPKVYRDPANTIYVEVNDEFVIALESNHSTGYSWQLLTDGGEAAFDTKVLELVGTEYEALRVTWWEPPVRRNGPSRGRARDRPCSISLT